MTQSLFYSSNAVSMQLTASIASGDTTCTLSSTSGLPASFPFKLLFDWESSSQEVVYCSGLSGLTATIQRGKDGSTAQSHSVGATIVHGVSAEEYNLADLHRALSAGVHGVTGSVVGTTDAQTLTNKTLTSPTTGGVVTETGVHSPDTSAHVGLIVKGLPGQSVDLQEWQNSTGTTVAEVDASGNVISSGTAIRVAFDAELLGNGNSTSGLPGLYIKSQTSDSPTVNTGGVLYVKNGALVYRGAGGTITTIANS